VLLVGSGSGKKVFKRVRIAEVLQRYFVRHPGQYSFGEFAIYVVKTLL
jgi:hypothetical protein